MKQLETIYAGLTLKNPIIVGSSGLTNSVEKIKLAASKGAGAVVLKSLFEEQISYETNDLLQYSDYPEAHDYLSNYVKNNTVSTYINLIKNTKSVATIPIIASVNCVSADRWTEFAWNLEEAGADAIELNMNIIPTNKNVTADELEKQYVDIISKTKQHLSIPVIAKISSHFTNLIHFADKLVTAGASGIVLFNRYYEPDIDIENMKFSSSDIFSTPADIRLIIRWIGLLSGKLRRVDISASTGVHDGNAIIKLLLAGATTVQVCSTLYKNGIDYLPLLLDSVTEWMEKHGYESVDDFRAKLDYQHLENPVLYERSQFMKYFSSID